MRAVVVERWVEPRDLKVHEVPELELKSGQVRVEVKAAGVNFFDILIVQGRYQVKPPFPFVPGSEIAGIVREVGEAVTDLSVGDRGVGAVPLGGFAERAVVPASLLQPVPETMSFEEAAGFPIVYPTSYAALVDRAALKSGETLLVHAAAGGVGIAAVQIGKALSARVIATAGGPQKLEVARGAGADHVIDYREGDWVAAVQELTDGRGADVIYDPVGGDVFDGSMKCIAWNGRLLVVGFAGGRIPEVKANRILIKNIAVVGLHWGAHAAREPERVKQIFEELAELYAGGKIAPLVYRIYPLDEVPAALEALGSRGTYGKLIIAP